MSDPDPSSLVPSQDKRSPRAQRAAFREDPHGTFPCSDHNIRSTSDNILGVLKLGSSKLVRNGQEVVKSGSRMFDEERRALQFASSLHVPVPALREASTSDESSMIRMDFVDGDCLEDIWTSLDGNQKQSIAEQIRDIVTRMRQATPTQSTIGTFGGPVLLQRAWSVDSGGPFNTEAEFNDFVLDLPEETPRPVRNAFAGCLNINSRIVFTHACLTPRNIIVKGDRVQAILSWQYSGWYPEYWEYVQFFELYTDCNDWRDYADVIFETGYPKELVTHQAIARWQFR